MEVYCLTFVYSIAIFVLSYSESISAAQPPCGNWIPFKDESCVKLVERAGLQTKEDAEIVCKSFAEELHVEDVPTLINVKTKEKQELLQKVLFEERATFDNVWLGLTTGKNDSFTWSDGTEVRYANWAEQNSSDKERKCVEMESGEGSYAMGQWVRVNCQKKNAIVCERTQTWTVAKVQNMLVNMKLELLRQEAEANGRINFLTNELINAKQEADAKLATVKRESEEKLAIVKQETAAKLAIVKQEADAKLVTVSQEADTKVKTVKQEAFQELSNMKKNAVPIGFVYVQLPGQQPPATLWPQATWTDISSKFAGNFFRVVGGNSAPFGQVQNGASPRLQEVMTLWNQGLVYLANVPGDGTWSNAVHVSFYKGNANDMYSLKFRLSASEVRPQNQAVIVWQRSK